MSDLNERDLSSNPDLMSKQECVLLIERLRAAPLSDAPVVTIGNHSVSTHPYLLRWPGRIEPGTYKLVLVPVEEGEHADK